MLIAAGLSMPTLKNNSLCFDAVGYLWHLVNPGGKRTFMNDWRSTKPL
jgi:hypothetical protein